MDTKNLVGAHSKKLYNEDNIQKGFRDGAEIVKGATLNEDYLEKHFQEVGEVMNVFVTYPDLYLDTIKPSNSNFDLFFYQRITLRAIMRFKDIYITAPRAFSKSFITILGLILQCIFLPQCKRFICAPGKGQSAQIAIFATLLSNQY